ncbi:MAG TPA: ATP-binding protein [Candidatus Saccharimonadales bacterium]|nr:ATP-binding protein [Candidatus Saccharimonadales bacterium]
MNPPNGGTHHASEALAFFEKVKLRPADVRDLFETCPMPLLIFHLETLRVLLVNSSALYFYGYAREEFLTKSISDIQPEENALALTALFKEVSPGFIRHGAWRHFSKDGRQLDVDVSWAAFTLDGQPCRIMLVHDITERRWAEQLLVQVHAHTENQLAARTMELDTAAQEVESFAQALLKTAAGLPAGPPAERLEKLCQGLLCLSRLTYNPVQPRPMDLAPLARTVAEEMEKTFPDHSVQFNVVGEFKVQADPECMAIVLRNLFRNAWVYTRQQGKAVIEFGAEARENEIVCHVRDDGVGFEQAMADKIFLPFQRFNPEHTGEGIGLSIVRRIIAKHAGRVWAQGTPNRGATIYFSLPAATEAASDIPA